MKRKREGEGGGEGEREGRERTWRLVLRITHKHSHSHHHLHRTVTPQFPTWKEERPKAKGFCTWTVHLLCTLIRRKQTKTVKEKTSFLLHLRRISMEWPHYLLASRKPSLCLLETSPCLSFPTSLSWDCRHKPSQTRSIFIPKKIL